VLNTFLMSAEVEAGVQPAEIQLVGNCFARWFRFAGMLRLRRDEQELSDDDDK
jgi:hypothetical protein